MASNRPVTLFLVLLSTITFSHQSIENNEVEVETQDESPLAEAAAAILKEQNFQNIGSMVSNFLQSDGGKNLGDILQNAANKNEAGQLLQGLGSMLGTAANKGPPKEEGIDAAELLQGLGSIMGAVQSMGGQNTGNNLLQNIGSMLSNQGQQGNSIDPSLIGSFINMFANQQEQKTQKKTKKGTQTESGVARNDEDDPGFDLSAIFSLAGSFLNPGKGNGGNSLLDALPMIMQTIGAFTGPEAEQRANSHNDHSWQLPPFLEKLHIFFDNFIHSDMGKFALNSLGAEKTFKVFTDENGRFNYAKFAELLENQSFRRHWIKLLTARLIDILQHIAEPDVQKNYLMTAQFFINSGLKSQGFPKSAMFDPARPIETITALVNHGGKKYFDMKIKSKQYVKPAVEYAQELLRLSQAKGKSLGATDTTGLTEKLTDTINLEIIEPVAKVNRAYRFARIMPKCERYVFCLVNQENQNEKESLPTLKKMLYKGASLVAGWFISDQTGTSFWTLYSDITENKNCEALYSKECNDFHEAEIKVTTEYVHSEL